MVDLRLALNYIDPIPLNYDQWNSVGMGLKAAANDGYDITWQDWDEWSQRDPSRYEPGLCEKKWHSFKREGITKRTVIQLAIAGGFKPVNELESLDFDAEINDGIPPRKDTDFEKYIKALFEPEDLVSIVTKSTQQDNGKFTPIGKGFNKPAKYLLEQFDQGHGEIENVIGDYNHDAGVWVRMNPIDGNGVSDNNVTQFKYTLIESDETDLESQYNTILNLRLPCAAIVCSGGKSIHAIVKVDAENKEEYRKRVEYIHRVLKNQNFPVDPNNKNASRLTRLPGVHRGHEKQSLLEIKTGYNDFVTWREYVENNFNEIELPEIITLNDIFENPPVLAPEQIEGILRKGHKMLISGPSKAGKSFCMIQLGLALAEEGKWFGRQCSKSKVLYLNLEIDDESFKQRVIDVLNHSDFEAEWPKNFAILNMRGRAQPVQKLVPKLINRIKEENYDVIILDPIYKVQSGDENAAGDIAKFTNELDKLCTELGTSLIYSHHHSKGNQGYKRAMDRASGSGVFARDPDAIIDMLELDTTNCRTNQIYGNCTGWRIEGTLREFRAFKPFNVFFRYPVHEVDRMGLLDDAETKDATLVQKNQPKSKEELEKEKAEEFDNAFQIYVDSGSSVDIKDLEQFWGIRNRSVRNKIKKTNDYYGYKKYITKDNIVYLEEE